jgi:beta-lactamase class A
MKRFFVVILLIFLSLICFGLGFFLHQVITTNQSQKTGQTTNCMYHYINSNRCEPSVVKKKTEYVILRNTINDYINKKIKEGTLTTAAVYFRDLENGPVLSINSQQDFSPASLLKLPLMIAFFRKAEDDPTLLEKSIKVPPSVAALPQNITPQQIAEQGKSYTINELITILITQSDNISGQLLLDYLNTTYPDEDFVFILSDLGIIDPRKSSDEQYVTVQSYASIFRILYNSSYLNPEMSNKALALMTTATFTKGIRAGISDEGVVVSHKFGERRNGDEQQLHDCGIVYYQPDPYLICIMTKGHDTEDLETVIQQVSKDIYDEVKNRT